MERKRLITILAIAGGIVLLLCGALAWRGVTWLRDQRPTPTPPPVAITRCDVNASGLCVVSFGTNMNNELVINMVAAKDLPEFYAQVTNRGATQRFRCERVEAVPTSAYCIGPRTPLGEPIELALYASEDDRLLAVGSFVVEAVALPTFSDATGTPTLEGGTPVLETPTAGEGSPVGTATRSPILTPTRTPTPPVGYP
jgi:hypothetical protein